MRSGSLAQAGAMATDACRCRRLPCLARLQLLLPLMLTCSLWLQPLACAAGSAGTGASGGWRTDHEDAGTQQLLSMAAVRPPSPHAVVCVSVADCSAAACHGVTRAH